MNRFSIDAYDIHWLTRKDDPEDRCLHGHAVAKIGDNIIEYDCTISATAMYLLKSLNNNKTKDDPYQMLPCCGHFYIPNDLLTDVYIDGCDNGEDWEVIHVDGGVELIYEGDSEFVSMDVYKKEVFAFCDKIKEYYDSSLPKVFPDEEDEFTKRGYIAYWNEWNRRRKELPHIYR